MICIKKKMATADIGAWYYTMCTVEEVKAATPKHFKVDTKPAEALPRHGEKGYVGCYFRLEK